MKKFKVSYSYPLEHPIKVVIEKLSRLGLLGWLMQKYGKDVNVKDLVISERIIELPLFHQWVGKFFLKLEGTFLEIGHVASSTSLELASLGFDVTAIDLRDYPFTHKNLKSIKSDFLKHEFNRKFDCIFSLSTIEHFGFSKRYGGEDEADNHLDEAAFKKISELLAPGGKAIVSFPYAKTFVPDIWFRVYTRNDVESKLERYFQIEESRFYRRDDNEWTIVTRRDNDPVSPHDGAALFLLKGK
ncbi:MAG: hypothetical protein A2665_01015 [Candidatus Zambryskibacteria bacterium RIFCSPHIGHO2_01_FULL_46_30]|uniref:Methyltransferase type 11 domain-containing protein n=1 Tax=Candidatus Zambryskibacteria bacterium RIFCSPHIGHO2_01_FULL_46_30 TaxID=1802739 RepID=A0A1G2T195_9BACT|nr:MAG: hypothetical protein A2665_01015 [Candidatus Zambryskibacteria bacterium RIFCSPHIGHO2_01_FULL_46_30]OHB06104.1 MAG: hypothetical protein A3B22_02295 [Candidatus Zambryskibacteria bacterium RIFCSPLOWO2_01_FULL_47_33]